MISGLSPLLTFCHTQLQATTRLTATLDGRLLREATCGRVAFELGAGLLCNGTCSGGGGEKGVTATARHKDRRI